MLIFAALAPVLLFLAFSCLSFLAMPVALVGPPRMVAGSTLILLSGRLR